MIQQIGFIGSGNMGLPMAANLIDAGYQLKVYNRTAEKAPPLVEKSAELADTPLNAIASIAKRREDLDWLAIALEVSAAVESKLRTARLALIF